MMCHDADHQEFERQAAARHLSLWACMHPLLLATVDILPFAFRSMLVGIPGMHCLGRAFAPVYELSR